MKTPARSNRTTKTDSTLAESELTAAEPDVRMDQHLGTVLAIPVEIQVVLGSATMPVAQLMKLNRGAVIPLNHRIGELVDITVNGRVVARGEIVVVDDDSSRFGVSLTEIVSPAGGAGSV